MMADEINLSCIMVIFGGTGDLTHRKLMPALYNLICQNMLNENFAVVSVGRRTFSDVEYSNNIKEFLGEFSRFPLEDEFWNKLREKIYYIDFDFKEYEGYGKLKELLNILDEKHNTKGNRIFYLAVAPEYFEPIVDNLKLHQMNIKDGTKRRIVIEKPFGRDLESAIYLNNKILTNMIYITNFDIINLLYKNFS